MMVYNVMIFVIRTYLCQNKYILYIYNNQSKKQIYSTNFSLVLSDSFDLWALSLTVNFMFTSQLNLKQCGRLHEKLTKNGANCHASSIIGEYADCNN